MTSHTFLAAILLGLSACTNGQSAGPAMTNSTVPRDGRGEPVLSAVPPPPPDSLPAPVTPAVASPAPGVTLR